MGYKGEQRRSYQRAWMSARRNAWIAGNGPCRRCGSTENLEVDHIEPRWKSGGLPPAQIWSRRAEVRKEELSKCQVLCEKCHKEKSFQERKNRTDHGKPGMYQNHGCRCDLCVTWLRNKWRIRRALKKQAPIE